VQSLWQPDTALRQDGNLKKTFDYPWKPVTVPADGKIKESDGATVALALSPDAAQTFMFVVNQNNSRIDIVERQTGKILSSLGEIGNLPGQFNQAHSVAVDSQNNLYVVENRGRRIQPIGVNRRLNAEEANRLTALLQSMTSFRGWTAAACGQATGAERNPSLFQDCKGCAWLGKLDWLTF
jgi:hypothetical protein